MDKDRIEMSHRERDVLKVMSMVVSGQRTKCEAARLVGLSVRTIRRKQSELKVSGTNGTNKGVQSIVSRAIPKGRHRWMPVPWDQSWASCPCHV
jgi:hypothetical protein